MVHSFNTQHTSLQQKTIDGAYFPIDLSFLDKVKDTEIANVVSVEEDTMIEHYIYYIGGDQEMADLIVLEGKQND